ncbi:putative short chain dehydrogenase/reductase family oxidoreductase [Aspergillus clavatus NRRL 1]|uniref:Short chain dehydrogenase/reductase family oxidoreductase, putative n=1 Tax=Aspergillus clavatus (strain ATCC 1007 / CBS 513.65 / DSM 816 / NCTC 3887 / NRRL 1 / QM 1276 / 107) TaxID=344612 RepID=A1CS84_ASPCL|nr:short chain dehydrogenase/reductase family oxidoreductase, putative [Aspergillus clavatus NRRL 1]EAW08505.1 short chain dehydrogenase/reductase family oxidoreductase, putative [Aspergillus clavatus NRRL 1]
MNFSGQTIFIGGGSKGLGYELAVLLIKAHAAHIVLFARNQEQLDIARTSLEKLAQKNQLVQTRSADLSDPAQIDDAFGAFPIPDYLFCVVGGATVELGYLIDKDPEHIRSCMNTNYFTAVFMAQAMLRIWVNAPPSPQGGPNGKPRTRHLAFTCSVTAFVGVPGYIAYTPTKCAVRAVADTLRQEVLRYNTAAVNYKVHCAFPANFVTPSFIEEQKYKPELTKRIEGTDKPVHDLIEKTPSPTEVARRILDGVHRDEYAIWYDFESSFLLSNMLGPTPKRGFGIVDSLLMVLAWIVWPFVRRQHDELCRKDGIAG